MAARTFLSGVLRRTLGHEAAPGALLLIAAAVALVLANSPLAGAYRAVFHDPLGWTPLARLATLHAWVNDAAMAVFFFVVGLEIKREAVAGELASPAQRRLPVLAALAGMAAPAAVYLAVAGANGPLARGWAIPVATDIAFALGVLALLGSRAPPSLRPFLLSVAIVDDLGAVVIIAIAYTAGLDLAWLAAALGVLATMSLLNRWRVGRRAAYLAAAAALWLCVLQSGVHPTVAGVLAAWCVPLRLDARGDSLQLEQALTPWVAFGIVPLFGFANAGVDVRGFGPAAALAPLPLAIGAGLLLGKQAGILGAVALADRLGFAQRPAGASRAQLWGLALLCGIGFTMSLFIAGLAFPDAPELVEQAKLGIIGGSLLSALAGYVVLRVAADPR